jgi:hypothetical protein
MSSCQYSSEVKTENSDGSVCIFKCKEGKDTLNSTRYCYYKSLLISETTFVNGKKEGAVIDYYPNGNIHIITCYRNGKANGVNKVFNEEGMMLRRSLYIDDIQVLFEGIMTNTEYPIERRQVFASINNHKIWAGELYTNLDGTPVSVGKLNIGEFQGMYVNVIVKDTLSFNKKSLVKLEIILPKAINEREILVGNFDKSLKCIDTIFYKRSDSIDKHISFMYLPDRIGVNYIVGRLSDPSNTIKNDIYFFKDFYVKE